MVQCVLAVWYYFGAVGSFIFILMQLILLVDFAHTWNQSWVENAENGNTRCWYAGKMLLSDEQWTNRLFSPPLIYAALLPHCPMKEQLSLCAD